MRRVIFAGMMVCFACDGSPSSGPTPESDVSAPVSSPRTAAAPVAAPSPAPPPDQDSAPPAAGSDPSAVCDVSGADDLSVGAGALNTAGYRCYRAGLVESAARLFAAAVSRDDAHALAHYNLACTLALLRAQGRVCEFDAHPDVIMEHVERSVELDSGRRARALADGDLAAVHDTVRYQVLAGADLSAPADLRRVLQTITLYSLGEGAFGSRRRVRLQPDGVAVMRELDIDAVEMPWAESRGTWSLDGTTLVLDLGRFHQRLTLTPRGYLEGPDGFEWMDGPSECDA